MLFIFGCGLPEFGLYALFLQSNIITNRLKKYFINLKTSYLLFFFVANDNCLKVTELISKMTW